MSDKTSLLMETAAVPQPSRREFIARIAGTGVAVAAAGLPSELFAQAAEAPKPPADPAGTVEYLATYYNRDSAAPAADPAAASAAAAQDPVQRLLGDNACLSCHGVDQKIVGPSFREVAARYAGDAGAGARIAGKIKAGGAGNWGTIPMPPHAGLSDAELAQLAAWILARK